MKTKDWKSVPDLVATSLMRLRTEIHGANVIKGCEIRVSCDFVAVSFRFPFLWYMSRVPGSLEAAYARNVQIYSWKFRTLEMRTLHFLETSANEYSMMRLISQNNGNFSITFLCWPTFFFKRKKYTRDYHTVVCVPSK